MFLTFNGATLVGIIACLLALIFKKGCTCVFARENFNENKFALSLFKSYSGLFVAFVLTAFTFNLYYYGNPSYGNPSQVSSLSPGAFYYYTFNDYKQNASDGSLKPLSWAIDVSTLLLIIATVFMVGALALYVLRFVHQPTTKNKFAKFLLNYSPPIALFVSAVLYWFFLSYFSYEPFNRINVAVPSTHYSLQFIILLVPLVIFDVIITNKLNKRIKKLDDVPTNDNLL